jgi:hypothetical protein
MFGYVQPLKPELKMKEYEAFKGYYCGLCKAIKEKYTNTARFMLNYDCAVLSLLLSSMSDEMPRLKRERCVVSPVKRKTVIRSREGEYAAAVNILLGHAKIKDAAADDKNAAAFILSGVYGPVAKRAAKDYPELAAEFGRRLENIHRLENDMCADIDAVSSEFGSLLGAVFSYAPYGFADGDKKALWHLGYNLGRWIYIADAIDDIIKDDRKKSYNVFLQRRHSDAAALKESVREEAAFNLNYSLAEACKAYELLDIKRDKPLLDNIMYLGLAKKTEDVLKGEVDGSV